MIAKDEEELICIDGWSMVAIVDSDIEGTGLSHIKCESWIRYAMHPDNLNCCVCSESIPEALLNLWLVWNADKPASRFYYDVDVDVNED